MIYLDNAATTKLDKDILAAMMPFLTEEYGNASSFHQKGSAAAAALSKARSQLAKSIGALDDEIYFTAGGTESDNWAILGTVEKLKVRGKHIISTVIEHHAVLHCLEYLEKQGFEVTYLPVYDDGIIKIEDLKAAMRTDTILVTIMFANNEIGTIQPIEEIGKLCREKGVLFHTDAVQAIGHVPVDVKQMNIDLLSLSAHKFNGPKGVGAMYMRRGVNLPPIIHGGAQERKKRAGTENIAGIVGLGAAVEKAVSELPKTVPQLIKLRDKLIKGVLESIPHTRLNGHPNKRLPGNANFSIQFIEGEGMLMLLDMAGICASSGSACTSGSLDPSHVLLAIGLPHEIAHGSLRLTLSHEITDTDVDYVLEKLPPIVERLRVMSPLYEKFLKTNN